jgi:branched-chain amino acid transport system permease protein
VTRGLFLFSAATLALAATPFVVDNYVVRLCTFLCMYAALALSWNFIGGYAGYPSFSTAGFFGLGAYAGALIQNTGIWLPLAWVGATLVVALFAAFLGYAILRMKGHYFAIGSISIVEILRLLASSWAKLTGGGDGLNVRILPGGPDFAGRVFLYSMMAVMVLALVTTLLVDRSRLGFGLRCIKQNEDAADMVGIDVNSYKIAAFTLSAMYCGTVGAIYASWVAYIDPSDAFSILLTLKVPVMALLGGPGTVYGPVLGAWAFVLLEEMIWAKFLEYNRAILGAVIVLLIFVLPGGLMRLRWPRRSWREALRSRRRRAGLTEAR